MPSEQSEKRLDTVVDRTGSQTREIDAQGLKLFCRDNSEDSMVIVPEAIMGQDVDGSALSEAVQQAEQRYASFGYGLATTGHGLRYIPLASSPRACQDVPGKRWLLGTSETAGRLYRVTYDGPRITVSLHHGLTDGRGAFEYLKTLLYHYLTKLGNSVDPEGKVLLADNIPATEDEYPFKKYGNPNMKTKAPTQGAAQLFGIGEDYFDERGEYRCRHVEITAAANCVVEAAHNTGVSVTSLLATVADRAIAEVYRPKDEIVLCCITTDMRPLFGSTTVQNFAGWTALAEVPAMRSMPIEAEAQALSQQLVAAHTMEQALGRMGERLVDAARFEETPVDEMFGNEDARMAEKRGVRSRLACLVTNVGVINLPQGIQQHVRQASFRIPSFNATISIAVSTCSDTFTIHVTQPFESKEFSRALAKTLSQLGIDTQLNDKGLETYDVLRREAVVELA